MAERCCVVCHRPAVYANDRCETDYRYLRRTGRDRAESAIVAYCRRIIEREVAENAYR